jgi:hypothetical protein
MKPLWRRITFLGAFLAAYLALSFIGFWLGMTTSTLGLRDGEPLPIFTTWQRFQGGIGSALIAVLWFPCFLADRLLHPLPGSDWFWIIGSGILYGITLYVSHCGSGFEHGGELPNHPVERTRLRRVAHFDR